MPISLYQCDAARTAAPSRDQCDKTPGISDLDFQKKTAFCEPDMNRF